MTARDALSIVKKTAINREKAIRVEPGVHLLEVLPRLLESPERELLVADATAEHGVIDSDSMLEALSRQIAARYDCSVIELECTPADFSASRLAHAVEDTDAHLVDMLTVPAGDGNLRVTLRVRCEDPTAAAHSLERYGYEVTEVFGNENVEQTASLERLLALQALINV